MSIIISTFCITSSYLVSYSRMAMSWSFILCPKTDYKIWRLGLNPVSDKMRLCHCYLTLFSSKLIQICFFWFYLSVNSKCIKGFLPVNGISTIFLSSMTVCFFRWRTPWESVSSTSGPSLAWWLFPPQQSPKDAPFASPFFYSGWDLESSVIY